MGELPLRTDRRMSAKELAETIIEYLGCENTDTNVRHLEVLLEAFSIFVERNNDHHDLWRQFGWQDSALHIRSKAARVGLSLRPDLDIDPHRVLKEIPDLINYAVFFKRNVEEPLTGRE